MNKGQIIAELENLVNERLFVGPWLMDRATNEATHRRLMEMGLVEAVGRGSFCGTSLLDGVINLQLFEVFIGHWDAWEVPYILKECGLIDENNCLIAWRRPRKKIAG